MNSSTAVVVAKVVGIVAVKYLLDMTDSIPFAAGFKKIAERFCKAVQSAFENWEALGEIQKSVEESCTLNLHLVPFTEIKDSKDVEYAQFVSHAIKELDIFFKAINSVSDWAERKYTHERPKSYLCSHCNAARGFFRHRQERDPGNRENTGLLSE